VNDFSSFFSLFLSPKSGSSVTISLLIFENLR
jgi:hypothetical protein